MVMVQMVAKMFHRALTHVSMVYVSWKIFVFVLSDGKDNGVINQWDRLYVTPILVSTVVLALPKEPVTTVNALQDGPVPIVNKPLRNVAVPTSPTLEMLFIHEILEQVLVIPVYGTLKSTETKLLT